MEEYQSAKGDHHQIVTSQGSIRRQVSEDSQSTMKLNLHRHVSLIYGLQFQSKVALFAKQQSQSTILKNFQNIPKEQLYKKVLSFLRLAAQDSTSLETFIKNFKTMDEEMELQIKKSTQSIESHSSEISFGSDSDNGSANKVKQVLGEMTNSCQPQAVKEIPTLRKAKTSMMSKSNRISIAQTININQLQKLTKIEAIQSAESLQSNKSSFKAYKSKRRLSSEHSENQCDTKSIPEIKAMNKAQRKNKISIMIMEDFSVNSQLFSEGDSYLSLSQIKLPQIKLDLAMLEVFFDPPTPYLVNLALCLFCKCMSRGQTVVGVDSVGWLLGVSTVVAYKLYYDEPIQGLIDWFCDGMNMELLQLVKLQRWFLASLNYQAAVSSQQYHIMLMQLMKHG